MSEITNFNPIKSINSALLPWGLAISNKQQIITKIAVASIAALAINHVLPAVGGEEYTAAYLLRDCIDNFCSQIASEHTKSLFRIFCIS